MNKEIIPKEIHHLIPMVEKWGIEDDGYRDELVENSSVTDLQLLVNSISDKDADIIDNWFCAPKNINKPSEEYIKFSVFFMAYEYAKLVLDEKLKTL